MRETFLDITKHTGDLGFIDIVKLTGTSDTTTVEAIDADKRVIIKGRLTDVSAELEGEFGFKDLALLKSYCNFANFKADGANIEVVREKRGDREVVAEVRFASEDGETSATYRVMNIDLVPEQPKFLGKDWDIEFKPTQAKIAEFASLASSLMSIEQYFMPKTDKDGNLRFYIGDETAATNKASLVFEKNVGADFPAGLYWPIQQVLAVLKLAGDDKAEPTIHLLAKGALQISFDSTLASWTYIFPGQRR